VAISAKALACSSGRHEGMVVFVSFLPRVTVVFRRDHEPVLLIRLDPSRRIAISLDFTVLLFSA